MRTPKPGSMARLTDRHVQLLRAACRSELSFRAIAPFFGEHASRRLIRSLKARGLLREVGAIRSPGRGRPQKLWKATDLGRLVVERFAERRPEGEQRPAAA
ncbi:MAG TPA: hypothetical protein VF161_00895 [Steroidobacteraceae bacterium]